MAIEIFVGITDLFEPLKRNATMTKLKGMKNHLNGNYENPYLHLMPAAFNCREDVLHYLHVVIIQTFYYYHYHLKILPIIKK